MTQKVVSFNSSKGKPPVDLPVTVDDKSSHLPSLPTTQPINIKSTVANVAALTLADQEMVKQHYAFHMNNVNSSFCSSQLPQHELQNSNLLNLKGKNKFHGSVKNLNI